MGRLRHWIKRLEKAGREEMLTIPLEDGGVAEFSRRDMVDAYLEMYSRAIGDPDTPEEEHPLIAAMRTSSDPMWRDCFADLLNCDPSPKPAENLSEQAPRH